MRSFYWFPPNPPIKKKQKTSRMTAVLKGIDQEVLKEPTTATEAEALTSAPYMKVDYSLRKH